MDQSITARVRPATKTGKVDQHSLRVSLLESTLCANLSNDELISVLIQRLKINGALENVAHNSMFTLWYALDTHLEFVKETVDQHLFAPISDDIPVQSPFTAGTDDVDFTDAQIEAMAVRHVHAEVFDMFEEE